MASLFAPLTFVAFVLGLLCVPFFASLPSLRYSIVTCKSFEKMCSFCFDVFYRLTINLFEVVFLDYCCVWAWFDLKKM